MKVLHSPKQTTKEIMDNLLACVKDKSLPIAERNHYYAEYCGLAANYLKMSR